MMNLMMIPWEQKQQIDIWIHMDSYGFIWIHEMKIWYVSWIVYIWAFATYKFAGTCSERERASPKKMERCFKDVVDNIFLLFSGFPLYCLFWGCYITCIYIYILWLCVPHRWVLHGRQSQRWIKIPSERLSDSAQTWCL